jgi:hypothetical protein
MADFNLEESGGVGGGGYVKDWHFHRTFPADAARLIPTPRLFSDDWLNGFARAPADDALSASTCRSGYEFVYVGPAGSGTRLHADVAGSYSWSAHVCGTKTWRFLPPTDTYLVRDVFGRALAPDFLPGNHRPRGIDGSSGGCGVGLEKGRRDGDLNGRDILSKSSEVGSGGSTEGLYEESNNAVDGCAQSSVPTSTASSSGSSSASSSSSTASFPSQSSVASSSAESSSAASSAESSAAVVENALGRGDLWRFPLLHAAAFEEVRQAAGDALFVPSEWLHTVANEVAPTAQPLWPLVVILGHPIRSIFSPFLS